MLRNPSPSPAPLFIIEIFLTKQNFFRKEIFTKGVGSLYKFNIEYRRTGTGTVPYGIVPYRTVPYLYRTVRYNTGNTAAVRYLYGTAPFGIITRRHVVLLKTAK